MTNLKKFQTEWLPKINQQLEADLSDVSTDDDLVAMMKYAVLNGGKRLRPLMTLAVVDSFGKQITPSILKVATAIEWIHSYSLVHDDLPAMDNDMFRRGKPSVHALYGESNAILVGDALLTGAFNVIATANDNLETNDISDKKLLSIVQNLSRESGGSGMVLGQIYDMDNHNNEQNIDDKWLINNVYTMKTAALLRFSALTGAILSDQHTSDTERSIKEMMYNFGENFGLAFQIHDDLDDYAQDQLEDINSLPHLLGVTGAKSVLEKHLSLAQKSLDDTVKKNKQFNRNLLDDFINLIGDKK